MISFKKNTKKIHLILLLPVVILLVFLFIRILITGSKPEEVVKQPPKNALYLNMNLPVETRIADLMSYMTLAEKVGQMTLVEKDSIHNKNDTAGFGLGAVLSGFGAKPEDNTIEGWKKMVSGFIETSQKSRLGIPILYGVDAIHGHSNVPGATVFPQFIGLGATQDAKLVEAVARATARELVATQVRWSFSPTVDIPRDMRWGRTYETFSDDTALVAKLGAAYIRGLQKENDSSGTSTLFVLSTPKHFVGVGGMLWGSSSNKNYTIDQGTTPPLEESLRREYLPPFKEAIDEGAKSIMVGLNSWGKTKLSANEYLLTTVLKQELGFTGFVVSDWYGVYEIPGSEYKAAVTAINAGVDMVMLPFDYSTFIENVVRAVRKGDIAEERINDAVLRILRAKFELGLFDDTSPVVSEEDIGSAEHRALAREAVAKSLVLLKNEESVVPIKKTVQHIRVAGSAADNIGKQVGAWTVEWQGIGDGALRGATTILEGIRMRVGNTAKVEYEKSGIFSSEAEIADVGIAVVGEKPYAEGWGDTAYPVLENEDLEAIRNLQATCKKVIVILVSGRPLLVANEIASWDALVVAWLPGSEGRGVADVLFGDKPFVGTLPLPWPHHSEQLPIKQDGTTADNTPLLFPRYFGLQ
jgi:beta-glucosidase